MISGNTLATYVIRLYSMRYLPKTEKSDDTTLTSLEPTRGNVVTI